AKGVLNIIPAYTPKVSDILRNHCPVKNGMLSGNFRNRCPKSSGFSTLNRIISEPDEFFVELLSETVEKICGYKPNDRVILDFIKESNFLQPKNEIQRVRERHSPDRINPIKTREIHPQQQKKSLIWQIENVQRSMKYPSWEILVFTAEWLINNNKLTSNNCPIPAGKKRYLVNTSPSHRHRGYFSPKILSNGLFIETHYSVVYAEKFARHLLNYLGVDRDLLVISEK
ncbi:MAG: hypothetical protein K9N22_07495, partial [Candidatus Marinimicrobia bacterium]|nr:hypothetical protein [Candidatus Neomarinimicrobiota bacterium]